MAKYYGQLPVLDKVAEDIAALERDEKFWAKYKADPACDADQCQAHLDDLAAEKARRQSLLDFYTAQIAAGQKPNAARFWQGKPPK